LYDREYTGANYGAKNDNRQSEPQVTMTKHPSSLIVTELHPMYSEAPTQDQFSRIHNGSISRVDSIPNPLHVFEQNLLTAAVVKFCGSAVGVAGDPLRGFKGAVIFQKVSDAGRPE
jgi:hypothetical protein